MGSLLFIEATAAEAEIAEIYASIESLEAASSFEETTIGLVNSNQNAYQIEPTAADFLDFKDVVLTRLRTALSSAYTTFNTDYACLAYTTLGTPGTLVLTAGTDQITVGYDVVANAETYKIYRSTTNDINTAVRVANTALLSFVDTGLETGTLYYYWVVAKAEGYKDSAAATDSETAA